MSPRWSQHFWLIYLGVLLPSPNYQWHVHITRSYHIEGDRYVCLVTPCKMHMEPVVSWHWWLYMVSDSCHMPR